MPETFDLVLRGGGVKGVAFVGALETLEQAKHRVRRLLGTSAGAIFATLYAAGYTPDEMEKVAREKDADGKLLFTRFTASPLISLSGHKPDAPRLADWLALGLAARKHDVKEVVERVLPFVPLDRAVRSVIQKLPVPASPERKDRAAQSASWALSLLLLGAACDDSPFLGWMKERFKEKKADPDITFAEFHKKFSAPRGQQLSLVATDTRDQEVLVLNHVTAPGLPVAQAVRMSMSIPFVWGEVAWQRDWKGYRGREKAGHPIVDGGVLANFPVRYFLDERHSHKGGVLGPPPMLDGKEQPARLLGLLLDSTRPVTARDDPPGWSSLLPAVQSAERLFNTMTETWDLEARREFFNEAGQAVKKSAVTVEGKPALCRIGTKGFSALGFDLTEHRLTELLQRGQCAMTDFLKGK